MIKKILEFTSATGGASTGEVSNIPTSLDKESPRATGDLIETPISTDANIDDDKIIVKHSPKKKRIKKEKQQKVMRWEDYQKDKLTQVKKSINIMEKINEDAYASVSSCSGMGDITAAQPSTNAGSTIGADFTNGGGTVGSGDIGVPFLAPHKKSQIGKKKRKISKYRDIYGTRQDYTEGQAKHTRTIKKFSDFSK